MAHTYLVNTSWQLHFERSAKEIKREEGDNHVDFLFPKIPKQNTDIKETLFL